MWPVKSEEKKKTASIDKEQHAQRWLIYKSWQAESATSFLWRAYSHIRIIASNTENKAEIPKRRLGSPLSVQLKVDRPTGGGDECEGYHLEIFHRA